MIFGIATKMTKCYAATVGNVEGPRPSVWDMLGRAKWYVYTGTFWYAVIQFALLGTLGRSTKISTNMKQNGCMLMRCSRFARC